MYVRVRSRGYLGGVGGRVRVRVGIRVKRRTMCLHYVALCEVHVRA